jgi:hypothetical protein
MLNKNTMIKLKDIIPQEVDLYGPNETYLGKVNEYEFLDVLVQIKENQYSGYYVIFEGQKIRIDKNGTLEDYPIGLFDLLTDLRLKLI